MSRNKNINLSAISAAFANFIYKSRQLTIEMIVCLSFEMYLTLSQMQIRML